MQVLLSRPACAFPVQSCLSRVLGAARACHFVSQRAAVAKSHNDLVGNVWAISDVHADYPENLQWAERLRESDHYAGDALIVAGDVSHDLARLHQTLQCLTSSFTKVFFTYGNHELWTRGRGQQ